MKLSTFLPILAVAEKPKKEKKGGDRSVERFVPSEVTNLCSDQVPSLGGDFEAINNGLSGAISLNNYSDFTDCKHVIQADGSCEAIQIKYRSIAVEFGGETCRYDSFRFGWTGSDGFDVTPGRCNCFGDGCDTELDIGVVHWWNDDSTTPIVGPNCFSIDSNNFTFYFKTDHSIHDGHVIFDWECVERGTTWLVLHFDRKSS